MKRWRAPKARRGQLKVQWGKLRHDSPDIIYTHGDGTSRADSRLLHFMFSQGHYSPLDKTFGKSLYDELESRGYDLTTLKFSISKKYNQSLELTVEGRGASDRPEYKAQVECRSSVQTFATKMTITI